MAESKKKRIYEVARDFNVSSDALLKVLRDLDHEVKNHMSTATPEMLAAIEARFSQAQAQVKVEESKRKEVHAAIQQHKAEEERAAKERAREAAVAKAQAAAPPTPPPPAVRPPEHRGSRPMETRPPRSSTAPPPRSRAPEPPPPQRHGRGGGPPEFPPGRRPRGTKGRKKPGVDERAVRESFQKTMAEIDGPRRQRRRRRVHAGGVAVDERENVIQAVEMMPLQDLAAELGVAPHELISKLFKNGVLATINQRLDKDTIEILAAEYEYEVEWISEFEETELDVEESEAPRLPRPPVVTIMGHVDHGKTSILDKIRRTNVVAGESGGITQHIGAYEVTTPGGHRITFLDTPGHEAFTAMRARGAQVTDLVVLVVAASDGVMPQTLEALNHARAANVPFLVAINKVDLPDANVERVKQQLAQNNVLLEDWGGTITAVEVSAKTGKGLEQLLELIHLQAEMLELKAPREGRMRGVVLEARKTPQHGVVVNVLVQQGTLNLSDVFVAGRHSGRVRALLNERERRIENVGPADPVQVLGCDGVPQAGDPFTVVESDRQARDIASKRQQYERAREAKSSRRVSLEQFHQMMREGGLAELKVVLKGDVDGSVEALTESLEKLSTTEVAVRVIHRGVGGINETDVTLAAASNAIVVGFHVRPSQHARELAKREGVDIRLYEVIYDVVNEVKEAMVGLLTPETKESIDGVAEVRQVFRVPKVGTIAGCYVTSGKITRNGKIRVIRDHVVVYDATVSSLKRFKDDVREVSQNFECGIGVSGFDDIKVGDVLEVYRLEEVARTL